MMFSTFMGQMMQMVLHVGFHMYRNISSLWDYGSSSYFSNNTLTHLPARLFSGLVSAVRCLKVMHMIPLCEVVN